MRILPQLTFSSESRWLRPTTYTTALASVLLLGACSKTDTTPIQLGGTSNSSNTTTAGGLVTDGVYTLTTKLVPTNGGASQRLDVAGGVDQNGQQVGVWDQNSQAPQNWRFAHQGNNLYIIYSQVGTKWKALDAEGNGTQKGTKVQLYASSQRWLLEDAGNGYFYLTPEAGRNLTPKPRLDVAGGTSTLGRYTDVQLWEDNGCDCQKWKLEAVAGGGGTTPGTGTTPPAPTGSVSGPPSGTGSWTQTFSDDFNSFNTANWKNGQWPCGTGNGPDCTWGPERLGTYYDPANVTVSNGLLNIKTERKAQGTAAFTSGVVTTAGSGNQFQQQYGYFEVRMKPGSTSGNDPDFWVFPLSKPAAGAQYKELDFAEFPGKGGIASVNVHMPFANESIVRTGNWTSDFHTYGVLWDANKITFYIDGIEQPNSVTQNILDEKGVLILSDEVRKDDCTWFCNSDNFQGPVTTQVDWVRVWKRS